jgi:hypothetical protein
VRAQDGELCLRRGVLALEGLGALDGQGGFQRVPL